MIKRFIKYIRNVIHNNHIHYYYLTGETQRPVIGQLGGLRIGMKCRCGKHKWVYSNPEDEDIPEYCWEDTYKN